MTSIDATEDYYTLLGVRPDGVAPLVDLVIADTLAIARTKAEAMLGEHASFSTVEVWRDGAMLDQVSR